MVNTGMSTTSSSGSSQLLNSVPKAQMGGKKSNGHKAQCKCPICKNMMKHNKGKRGGADDDSWDIEMGAKPTPDASPASVKEGDYDAYDAAEKGEAGPNVAGGTRKRRGRKSRKGRKSYRKSHKKSHTKRRRSSRR